MVLKVIANNTANMNTPGFKSSSLQFLICFIRAAQRMEARQTLDR